MKILLTMDNAPGIVNGVVFSTLSLKKELDSRGHDIRLLALSDSSSSRFENGTWYVPSADAGFVYPGLRFLYRPIPKTMQEITAWGPELVHSQTEGLLFYLTRRLSHDLKIPHVHTVHTKYDDYLRYLKLPEITKPALTLFCRMFFQKPDLLIVPSQKTKDFLRAYHVTKPIEIVPTGIDRTVFYKETDADRLNALRKEFGVGADRKILVFSGRLAAEKSIDYLLSCFFSYPDPDVVLLLAGDGPQKKELEAIVNKQGDRRVLFTGMVTQDKLRGIYSVSDVFVCASLSETQGLTYYEAASCGLPLLCRYDPCLDALLTDGENGFFFRTKEEFCDRLEKLLKDDALRRTMSENALEKAELFSTKAFGDSIERIYAGLIDKQRPQ